MYDALMEPPKPPAIRLNGGQPIREAPDAGFGDIVGAAYDVAKHENLLTRDVMVYRRLWENFGQGKGLQDNWSEYFAMDGLLPDKKVEAFADGVARMKASDDPEARAAVASLRSREEISASVDAEYRRDWDALADIGGQYGIHSPVANVAAQITGGLLNLWRDPLLYVAAPAEGMFAAMALAKVAQRSQSLRRAVGGGVASASAIAAALAQVGISQKRREFIGEEVTGTEAMLMVGVGGLLGFGLGAVFTPRARVEIDVSASGMARVPDVLSLDEYGAKAPVAPMAKAGGIRSFDQRVLDDAVEGFFAGPETPKVTQYPMLGVLRAKGGIDIDGPLAKEIRAMGVTNQTLPGLFRRREASPTGSALPGFEGSAGRTGDFDDLTYGEVPFSHEGLPSDRVPRQRLLDAISNEVRGAPEFDADTTVRLADYDAAYVNHELTQMFVEEELEAVGRSLDGATPEDVRTVMLNSRFGAEIDGRLDIEPNEFDVADAADDLVLAENATDIEMGAVHALEDMDDLGGFRDVELDLGDARGTAGELTEEADSLKKAAETMEACLG